MDSREFEDCPGQGSAGRHDNRKKQVMRGELDGRPAQFLTRL
ncbi:MAG: hypothetical protein AAGM22_10170 [Acidobacteriota bacterium]